MKEIQEGFPLDGYQLRPDPSVFKLPMVPNVHGRLGSTCGQSEYSYANPADLSVRSDKPSEISNPQSSSTRLFMPTTPRSAYQTPRSEYHF